MHIKVAENAGFCFGVKRAVTKVFESIGKYGRLCTYGELIHNESVVSILRGRGVEIIESVDEAGGEGTAVVIRSHGVPKAVLDGLAGKGCAVIDLTCPFVKRIHNKVRLAEDRPVIIVGSAEHPEVVGIEGWAGGPVYVVASAEQAEAMPLLESALVVAQTTITQRLWDAVIDILKGKVGDLEQFCSICDTTRSRQSEAEKLAQESDVVLVVGGRNSSNTQKLYELCRANCEKTYCIENIGQLSLENIAAHDIISIVAGASTPDWLIREVKTHMSEVENTQGIIEETEVKDEAQQQTQESQENEDFMAEIDKSFVYIKRGQIVAGTVVQVSDNEICVNIGYKSDGIIKKENLTSTGDAEPQELFGVGDEIEAEVVSLNDGEGNVVLSRKSIESKLKWKELVENLDPDKTYTINVSRVVKGGVLSKLEGYDAFIPASQLSLKYVEDLSEFVGQDLDVTIIEVDKRQRRFVLSHKNILMRQQEQEEKKLYETFTKGDKVTGRIKQLTDFGAFVDIGGVDGLLHITDIAWVKPKHPSELLKAGEDIEVLILNVDPDKKRVSLGAKQLTPKPWEKVPEKYLVGDVVEGTVVRIMPFGAFVSLEPMIDGLIHISQVTNRRLEKVEDELRIGDTVKAKILEVDAGKKRISLSVRALIDEEEKSKKKDDGGGSREEKFHYEIPPVEGVSSSLADFFPKVEEAADEPEEIVEVVEEVVIEEAPEAEEAEVEEIVEVEIEEEAAEAEEETEAVAEEPEAEDSGEETEE